VWLPFSGLRVASACSAMGANPDSLVDPFLEGQQSVHSSTLARPLPSACPSSTTAHTCGAKAALLLTPFRPMFTSLTKCLPQSSVTPLGGCIRGTCQNSNLRDAIVKDDADGLRDLLQLLKTKPHPCLSACGLHADVNELLDGTTGRPLHLAAQDSSAALVRLLVQSGQCNVNAPDVHRRTALHIAAARGAHDVILELLNDPTGLVRVDEPDGEGRSPLQVAVVACQWDCARLLISRGASVSTLKLKSLAGKPQSDAFEGALDAAADALAAFAALWPPPSVRYCAVCSVSCKLIAAQCFMPASPYSALADPEVVRAEETEFGQLLRKVMSSSARLQEHPRLTVSTEVGMMHYEMNNQTDLLFVAFTQPDLPQSSAFSFLQKMREEFFRQNGADAVRKLTPGTAAELPAAEVADMKAFLSAYNDTAAASAASPHLSERAQLLLETARGVGLARSVCSSANAAASLPADSLFRSLRRLRQRSSSNPAALTASQLDPILQADVRSLSEACSAEGLPLPRPHAILLLRKFGWSRTAAMVPLDFPMLPPILLRTFLLSYECALAHSDKHLF